MSLGYKLHCLSKPDVLGACLSSEGPRVWVLHVGQKTPPFFERNSRLVRSLPVECLCFWGGDFGNTMSLLLCLILHVVFLSFVVVEEHFN